MFESLIITAGELQTQGVVYNSSTSEMIFNGKQFKRQLSCRKSLREALLSHCKRILRSGESCLLVEEENFLTLWRAREKLESAKTNKSDRATVNESPAVAASVDAQFQPTSTAIEPAFLAHCHQTLAHYIGLTATRRLQEILYQFPNLTHRQLVDRLAATIADPQQAEEFWQRVLTRTSSSDSEPISQNEQTNSAAEQVPSRQKSPNAQVKRMYRGISY